MKTEFCANPDDWDDLAEYIKDTGNVVFPYVLDGGGALILIINREFMKCGLMPFGGSPDGRIYVTVFGRGSDHFESNFADGRIPTDLGTRLGITAIEAVAVAQLFRALNERLA